ncbi:MAG: valine--tRNA ligase [Patescibacteria group bacterium]|jgi:valyl-tRNA synthetase
MNLPKAYNAQDYEDKIYKQWEASGYFNPDNLPGNGEPFSLLFPPPNVTGVLHLGHALENALMDTQIRYQRMLGKKALLLPGTDHSAVATQARVEKNLQAQGIKHPRTEYGREKLVSIIRDFAEQSKSTILNQIKKLGTSCDWSRLAYTFDEQRSRAVNELFVRMYRDGLVYKGYRVINWSVKGQSTCSDDELVYVEQTTKLYTFKYSKDFPIAIATTRPETKLGDTAVAVHPNDERYQQYIGKEYTINIGAAKPLVIKIIADDTVDMNYGTGAVGVTPAHSMADYDMYLKHPDIGLIQVISEDGCMTEQAGKAYQGLTALAAREKLVAWLKDNNLIIKEEELVHSVGTSDRFSDVVEVIPKEQWFVNVNKIIPGKNKTLKDLMREAAAKIKITPERFEKTYLRWIENLRDWCISRQIWWGHRIPAWYKDKEVYVGIKAPLEQGWQQDEDTLDTWFSSGTWTFSTLGWPKQTADLKKFHPISWMQMGHEIIFFWMARMILMTTYALDSIPFKEVYIHGMLRDKQGRKFSKSLGNGINPLDVIKQYGADALRLSLLKGITPGNDSKFYEEKVEDSRNFVNKVWNVARYVTTSPSIPPLKGEGGEAIADSWIESKLNRLIQEINNYFEHYQYSLAAEKIYEFLWHDFADWYIEITKFQPNPVLTKQVLETTLKLLHPFIPFVTEVLWSELHPGKLLMIETWPQADATKINPTIEKQFADIQDIVTQIRDLRAKYNIAYSTKITLFTKKPVSGTKDIIEHLTKVVISEGSGMGKVQLINDAYEFTLDLQSVIDVPKYQAQLKKEIVELKKYVVSLNQKLNTPEFISKAPARIIEVEQKKLADKKAILEKLEKSLQEL